MKQKLKIIIIIILAVLFGIFISQTYKKVANNIGKDIDNFKGKYLHLPKSFSNLRFITQTEKETDKGKIIKIVSEESQVIDVVKKASPTVVSIVASAEIPTFETYYQDPFGRFSGEMGGLFDFRTPQRKQNGTREVQVGAGTGFIVSADGYIVTNKHVVASTEAKYIVYLNSGENKGEKIEARVLAKDPNTDLAILKIERNNLPHLEFSSSDELQVGQTVITIGYALGEFDNTVSKGVVSGLSRSITAGGGYAQTERLANLIQTDAAINPGNSGGPMLNINGDIIGVNVAMASAENIGFAIPGNLAKADLDEVVGNGNIAKKDKAFLGIRYILIDKDLQRKNNLPYDYGALVSRGGERTDIAIVPGSAADKAGIVENDIILEIEGKKINERNGLLDIIFNHQPEDIIKLKIYHKGDEKEVEVTLGKS